MDLVSAFGLRGVGDTIVGMKKYTYYCIGLVLGLVVLVMAEQPGDKAKMVVCDVGQGDAILIIKGRNQVLIDGGPSSEKILSCLGAHVPFYDRQIELIVLTNTDFDHMNGLSAVIDRYSVSRFVTADGVHESDALLKFIGSLERSGVVAQAVEQGDQIRVGGEQTGTELIFDVLWPPETIVENVAIFSPQMDKEKREQILGASAKRGNLNERSVVLLLLEDNKRILLTGDAGDQTEKVLLDQGLLSDIDVLKVGHHGSKYASTQKFLEIIKPELAVISVGAKNTYGHPTPETLQRLSKVGTEVHRTDQEGTIEIEL